MRRWNGWGDDSVTFELPRGAAQMLGDLVGPATPAHNITLADVVARVPPSRLPAHPLVSTEAERRVRFCRGQSFPDWVAFRSGRFEAFPDGVAAPRTGDDVRELLVAARAAGARVIPYGGGTSVLGHINPIAGEAPVLTMSMEHLSRLRQIDPRSHLATFGAGANGQQVEEQLEAHGFTLGHFPQSFELSTLGGWVAARSSGQQSLHYGRIEDLFAGGVLEAPVGTLELPPFPASAAGPDLREMVLGSEGRFGVLTEVTVRVSRTPEAEEFHAVFFPGWDQALTASREIVQARVPLSMMRVSTTVETATTLAMAGHEWLIAGLERLLSIGGIGDEKCMLMLGATGSRSAVRFALREAIGMARAHRGRHLGQQMGRSWSKKRYHAPYARNTLWDLGYGVDTLETAINWSDVPGLVEAIERALRDAFAAIGEKIHVFTHLSHLYPHGSNIYTSFIFRLANDPEETLRRWGLLKRAASEAITAHQGTISHQHGVGTDHMPYLEAEKGTLGLAAIRDLCARFDPDGMMNPGKLVA